MSAILDNLFLGSVDQGGSPDFLIGRGITHVLTLDIFPVGDRSEKLIYKYIKAYDHPDFDLLSYFDECFDFIDQALENGGRVFVHCQFGVSRSATIVGAYLMRKRKLSIDDALEKMRESRLVNPNQGFMEQLILYHKLGCTVNKRHTEYREYVLKKIAMSPKNAIIPEDILPEDDFELAPNEQGSIDRRILYRCRKCRKNLFTSDCLLKRHESSTMAKCSDSLFICPLRWMLENIRQTDGKINCPHCDAKLGAFRWSGEQCGCGVWVTPSFRIQSCKLDTQTLALKNQTPSV